MSCEDFEQRLNEVLDDRGNPATDRELVEHARRCFACQRLLLLQSQCLGSLNAALMLAPAQVVEPVRDLAAESRFQIGQGNSHTRDPWGKGRGRWKRWSAMVSPLAVSLALAVVMWSAGSQERASVDSERARGLTAKRGSWPGVGALAWSGPRGRGGGGERISVEALQPVDAPSPSLPSANDLVGAKKLVGQGEFGSLSTTDGVGVEEDWRIREQLTRWRESIATLPSPPLRGVSQWAEGMRPVADSVGCLVEAVRESVLVGRTERPESSLDTTWVTDGNWVA